MIHKKKHQQFASLVVVFSVFACSTAKADAVSDCNAKVGKIVAAAVGTVLRAEVGTGAMPTLTTTIYLVKGPARSWATVDELTQEVANARIYDGVHYRDSTEVGTAMGKQVGELAVVKFLRRPE